MVEYSIQKQKTANVHKETSRQQRDNIRSFKMFSADGNKGSVAAGRMNLTIR